MRSRSLVFRVSSLMLFSAILLLFTGVFNVLFSSGPLAGWKQLLVGVTFILAFFMVRQDPFLRALLVFVLWGALILVVSSFIHGVPAMAVFYNLFFYIAWVPFFIWAAQGGVEQFQKFDTMMIVYLIVSCIGLIVDLKTELFMFMHPLPDIVTAEFLENMHTTKRAIFIFTAPNLVMPICSALIVILLLRKYTVSRMLFGLMVMTVVILTTASMNATVLACIVAMGILFSNIHVGGRGFYLILLVGLIGLLINVDSIDLNNSFIGQIDRILNNLDLDSKSNNGRFYHWALSLSQISEFSFLEHLMGSGLGVTNGKYDPDRLFLLSHGESSYFQAYAEGGVIGLLFRLLPFALLFVVAYKCRNRRKVLVLGYGIGIFFVYAVAPLFPNIFSQMLLGMLVGYVFALRRYEQRMEMDAGDSMLLQPIGKKS